METRAVRNTCVGVLTWASGYNFPLFLVYPVDMPVINICICRRARYGMEWGGGGGGGGVAVVPSDAGTRL